MTQAFFVFEEFERVPVSVHPEECPVYALKMPEKELIYMADLILFDLDGTLTDPEEGITNSVVHALQTYGIPGFSRPP